jgi:hypothetical protein
MSSSDDYVLAVATVGLPFLSSILAKWFAHLNFMELITLTILDER